MTFIKRGLGSSQLLDFMEELRKHSKIENIFFYFNRTLTPGLYLFDDPMGPKNANREEEDKRVTLLFEWQKDKQTTWFLRSYTLLHTMPFQVDHKWFGASVTTFFDQIQ